MCAIPMCITVGAIELEEALGSWDRVSAGTSSGFDGLLAVATVLSFAVFLAFPLPAIALSFVGLMMNPSKFALIALLSALIPIAYIAYMLII